VQSCSAGRRRHLPHDSRTRQRPWLSERTGGAVVFAAGSARHHPSNRRHRSDGARSLSGGRRAVLTTTDYASIHETSEASRDCRTRHRHRGIACARCRHIRLLVELHGVFRRAVGWRVDQHRRGSTDCRRALSRSTARCVGPFAGRDLCHLRDQAKSRARVSTTPRCIVAVTCE
jgi:hypothetical protein